MENNILSLPCEIVKDLLPLYHDKVVNEVTECAVKKHLDTCESCAQEYVELCRELPEKTDAAGASKMNFDFWKQNFKKKQNRKIALIAGLTCLIAVALILELCHDPLIPTKVKNVKTQQMYEIERKDGSRVMYVRADLPRFHYTSACNAKLVKKNDKTSLVLTARIALPELFFNGEETTHSSYFIIPMNESSDQNDMQEIFYDEELIWTKGQNDKADILPYITAFADPEGEGVYSVSEYSDRIAVTYDDGNTFSWTLDGDIQSEHYKEDAEDKYFNGTVLAVQEEKLLVSPNVSSDFSGETALVFVSLAPLKENYAELLSLLETGTHIRIRYHADMAKDTCTISDADRLALGWSFDELP